MTTPTIEIDGKRIPFTLRNLPLVLRALESHELNVLGWSEAVRRELVSRHRNPPEPNVPVVAVRV